MFLIGITISISLTLSTCVLFISLTQLINGVQFLNITFLSELFASVPLAAIFVTAIFLSTSIYASL